MESAPCQRRMSPRAGTDESEGDHVRGHQVLIVGAGPTGLMLAV